MLYHFDFITFNELINHRWLIMKLIIQKKIIQVGLFLILENTNCILYQYAHAYINKS